MMWPRDENLRLIGAEEEAQHIGERLRNACNATIISIFLAVLCFGFCYFISVQSDWVVLTLSDRENTLIWAALACSICCFFCVFYGVRMIRYVLYRQRHRAFLRKYNRL